MRQIPVLNRPPDFEGGLSKLWYDPNNPDQLIKKFNSPLDQNETKLLVELNDLLYKIRPSIKERLIRNFSWPLEVFGSEKSATGISIPLAPKEYFQDVKTLGEKKKTLMEIVYLIDKSWWDSPIVDTPEPLISLEQRIELCHHLITTLLLLWESGAVYGDFSFKNLIWTLEPYPKIMFLDADTATADNKYDRRLHSPGWREHLLPNLSPQQKDFRLSALLIWRILGQTQRCHPGDSNLTNFLNKIKSDLRLAIQDLWNEMTFKNAVDLQTSLNEYREDQYIKKQFQEAKQDGFARLLVLHTPKNLSQDDLSYLTKAREWQALELNYESKRGRSQVRFARLNLNSCEFVPDVVNAPSVADISRPETFWSTMRDGDFSLIAENFDRFDASSEFLPFVQRAVEHALVELDPPSVNLVDEFTGMTMSWTFPPSANWVNGAVVSIFDVNGQVMVTKTFSRKPALSRATFTRSPNTASIEIRWKSVNAQGVEVVSPSAWSQRITVLPSRAPSSESNESTRQNDITRPRITIGEIRTDTRDLQITRAIKPVDQRTTKLNPQSKARAKSNGFFSRFRLRR